MTKKSRQLQVESLTGCTCPKCNRYAEFNYENKEGKGSFKYQTKPEFSYFPDPHYRWKEIHHCPNCRTTYILHNGT